MFKTISLKNMVVAGITAFLLLAVVPARADDVAVKIGNFTFGPQDLKVKAGTTVTWTNEDDIPHTVVSVNNFRSKPLDSEDKFSFTFTTPGTYKYFCSLHPHMTGTIVVEAATGSIAPPHDGAIFRPGELGSAPATLRNQRRDGLAVVTAVAEACNHASPVVRRPVLADFPLAFDTCDRDFDSDDAP